jgi:hypothetical protein
MQDQEHESRRAFGNRIRDAVLMLVAAATIVHIAPAVQAAWDKTKPATNGALVSADIRANWTSLETAFGNLDTVPLTQVATNFSGAVQAQSATATQFFAPPTYKPGTDSSLDAVVSGVLAASVDTTQHGNVTTGATTLSSFSLPANVLSANGKIVRITAWGTYAANANNKVIKVFFGATSITLQNGASNTGTWRSVTDIVRTGAATQKMNGIQSQRVSGAGDAVVINAAPAETLSGAVTIKTEGTATATNDILQEGFYVEVLG